MGSLWMEMYGYQQTTGNLHLSKGLAYTAREAF